MDVKLIMFKPNGQRKDFPIINPRTVLGRAESCDLRVPLLSVSRRHCELALEGDNVKVRDLGSSNGTYVNNQRITEQELAAGDRLVIGPIVFTVQIDGKPEQITPVKTKGQKLAEQGQSEEVVDLDADVVAQPGASALESSESHVEEDPISALEALAGGPPEGEEEKEQEEEKENP
jgi:pSer/pThr/pTyr-binding forkhead associated (FHA) protein